MLNNFLRDIYKSKVISSDLLRKTLSTWKITDSSLSKTFVFEDFEKAMTFSSLAAKYVKIYQINSEM